MMLFFLVWRQNFVDYSLKYWFVVLLKNYCFISFYLLVLTLNQEKCSQGLITSQALIYCCVMSVLSILIENVALKFPHEKYRFKRFHHLT